MTNIRCKGNKEIDLLAMNPKTLEKYHVESRVSTTFKLKSKDTYSIRGNVKIPHRDGIDFFHREKFKHKNVKEKILEIFGKEPYQKILVVWDVDNPSVISLAERKYNIEIRFIDEIIDEIIDKGKVRGSRDDVLRLIELMSLLETKEEKRSKVNLRRGRRELIRKLAQKSERD